MTALDDSARRAKESSPVRQHWENDGPVLSPGTGRKNRAAEFLTPRSGADQLARLLPTAVRRGLFSFALRALLVGCRLPALGALV